MDGSRLLSAEKLYGESQSPPSLAASIRLRDERTVAVVVVVVVVGGGDGKNPIDQSVVCVWLDCLVALLEVRSDAHISTYTFPQDLHRFHFPSL